MANLSNFVSAIASGDGQPLTACRALERLADELIGVRLFTLTTVDPKTRGAGRIYSNMPEAYPIRGTKPADETDWSKIVLTRHETFVASTIEDIAKFFPDYELIKSLGCESVINVPVVVTGNVIGTINCLHNRNHYTKERVSASEKLKLPAISVFLLAQSMT